MIGDPPSLAGAVNDTVAWPGAALADAFVGAPGGNAGVTADDAEDSTELPLAFVACTVKV